MLSKEENVFGIYVLDCGLDSRNFEGFLTKFTPEGVSGDCNTPGC
jgi:hypothetical protein